MVLLFLQEQKQQELWVQCRHESQSQKQVMPPMHSQPSQE